ncbi:carboxypeptidase N subunit 2-like [Ischnura elegans]|uniref:carboxypeptidase N subunit 2-like n=1 Tax=Ischnura elegans TaxID=197161 RepID=UPI001ED87138|nr:carboxypeptidase N subunit 2-like [Ischnura elegans]
MLKVLILSHNVLLKFENLTGPILISETLQELDLSNCSLSNLPEGAFSSLPSLKYLNLHHNILRTLPPKIFHKLTSLSHLDLSDNLLHLPSDTFEHNSYLKILNLSKHNTEGYSWFDYLKLIDDVNDGNQQTPILISPSIETLDLSGVTIKIHKLSLNSLPNLRHLKIDGSISQTTSEAFQSLKNLETLQMRLNGHENVNGDIFKKNSKLKYLKLTLTNFPISTPLSSASITHLDVFSYEPSSKNIEDYNEPTNNLPAKLTGLEVMKIKTRFRLELREFFLRRNPNLRVFDLSECNLRHIPPNLFAKNPHIKEIILHDNYLTSARTDEDFPGLFSEPNNAEHLDLSDNLFKHIPRNFFSSLTSLVCLNLSKNPLFGWEEGAFSELSHLEVLDLSQTHLLHLRPDPKIKNLAKDLGLFSQASTSAEKVFNNTNNKASNYSFHLLHLKTLKVLDLSKAGILSLPNNTFSGTPSLEKLDLSNNALRMLDPNMLKAQLHNLTYLDLSNNPWRCGCKMAKLRDFWVARNMDPLNHLVVCDKPKLLHGQTWDAIKDCGNFAQLQQNSNPQIASIKDKTSQNSDPKNEYPSQDDEENPSIDNHLIYELSEPDTEPSSFHLVIRVSVVGLIGMILAIGIRSAIYYFVVRKRYRVLLVDEDVSSS